MRGTSADDLVSINQGCRKICLYRTLPFKPSLLRAALDEVDEEDKGIGEEDRVPVREEDQMLLHVSVVGSLNAGKSKLTNRLVSIHIISNIFALIFTDFSLLSLIGGQYSANEMVHNP